MYFTGPGQPIVATIREEGSNGDREMVAALHMAGFEVLPFTSFTSIQQDLLTAVVVRFCEDDVHPFQELFIHFF